MKTVHVVSHTHWDREWYRTFQQFRLQLVQLIDGLLEILAGDPGFRFFTLDGQTIILDDYLQVRPEREAILCRHVRQGRLLIGPWHVLPDMFLVGPEAHIRNLLQGDRTARRFGAKMKIGYLPDPFGHPGQTPQILQGFGIDTACIWRGVDRTNAEFWWQAPDGTRVLAVSMRDGYGNGASLPAEDGRAFAQQLAQSAASLAPDSATSSLLVMYGTDHMEPPRNTAAAIAHADRHLDNTRVVHSTLPYYVASIRKEIERRKATIPVVEGELRSGRRMHLLPGVLSTRMWIKQRNRACELLLEKWVEPFGTFRERLSGPTAGATAPTDRQAVLHQAWRLLMENHAHDSICGCSIDQVHEEMRVRFDQVDQIGEELTQQTLAGIAGSVNTLPPERARALGSEISAALVVFNPQDGSRSDVVTASFASPLSPTEFDLVDEWGDVVPYQEQGLGTREIASMTLDGKSLRAIFGNIVEGRAAGMAFQDLQVRREGPDVFIDAVLAQGGEPNLPVWDAAIRQLEAHLADPSIATYRARARSASSRLTFVAPQVPGRGYATFWVRPRKAGERPAARLNPLLKRLLPLARLPILQRLLSIRRRARPPFRIENETFSVEAQADGSLTVLDKQDGMLYSGLNRFLDGGDCGDEYNYAPPETDRPITARLRRAAIRRGPVQQSMELELALPVPTGLTSDRRARAKERILLPVTTVVTLSRGVPRVDLHSRVENRARDHRLRAHFPAPFAAASGHHDGHFEVVERPMGVPPHDPTWVEEPRPEVPQRAFTSVSDGTHRLTIANRGLPEVEVLRNARGNAEIAL
ncbi:MAG: hypothetical protein FJZ97_02495, partial [Chloroflexi bacterium]|nr:hypothetical protein [Chloroflexota bacterium]